MSAGRPFYVGDQLTLHQGDALTVLRSLPSDSVNAVVTSPPYCGLRDYGGKWGAIRAALLGGRLSVLITDQETAAELVCDR